MERYILIDHTADLMVKAFGSTVEECFANAGFALFDQTVDLANVGTSEEVRFEVEGMDDEDMLYSFLSELLFMLDCDEMVFKELKVCFDGNKVVCDGRGEKLDRSKHRTRSEIKAVTYHMMEVDRTAPSVTVVFDV
ncbi:MAG: archease [Candidatus Methanomethylophilaceae archaeon]|jgi:SHS2 domain-containing protein|nr:archease [Candidatus Methanomethylophilaceae archaeon]